MLARPAALTLPRIYRRLAQQQFVGLLMRLALVITAGWTLGWRMVPPVAWHAKLLSHWLFDAFTLVSLGYLLLSSLIFFAQMIWAHRRWVFVSSSVCDSMLVALLLILYPGQAWVGFGISVVAMLAMLQGLGGRLILGSSVLLLVCALIVAHLNGILVASGPLPIHAAEVMMVLFALMGAWHFEQRDHEHLERQDDTNPVSGLPRIKALYTSLHYLLPYHQRNKMPLSFIMMRIDGQAGHEASMQELSERLLSRIRRSDVLVHAEEDDLVIMLCDTPVAGASALARDLSMLLGDIRELHLNFAVSAIELENAAIDPLLQRMRDLLKHAAHQNTDRILFVTEERQAEINS